MDFDLQTRNPDLQTRIHDAKAFVKNNPDTKIAHVANMFTLPHTTLYSAISRDKKPVPSAQRGGYNQILEKHQVEAIHKFIRSLLVYGIQPTFGVIFNAIVGLKHAQNPEKKKPSERWFRIWWKEHNLHKIKTKSIAMVWFTAAQEKDVHAWFVDDRKVIKSLRIKSKKDIINFDEARFKVSCMKGHDILVPADILEVHTY